MPRWRRSQLVASLLVGLVVAGCTAGPSQRPAVAVRGEGPVVAPSEPSPPASTPPVPPLEPGQPSRELTFVPCTPAQIARIGNPAPGDRTLSLECADIPVDAGSSGSRGVGQVSIGLVRVGLADAAAGRAPVVVLGESDGAPSSTLAARWAAALPLPLLQRVQLVGVDRRGSVVDRLDCSPDPARAAIVDFDPFQADATRLGGLLEQARTAVQECYTLLPEALASFGTAGTAADLDRVRQLLGVAHLPVIGVGDGARAAGVWADHNPGTVGRLVLDTPPDPALDVVATARARATAAEASFEAFARDCTSRPGCALGADPRQAVRGLLDRLGAVSLSTADGHRLTPGSLARALQRGLDEPAGWPALAKALAAAGAGDPAPVLTLLDPVVGLDGNFDIALATECNDTKQRVAPTQVLELIKQWRTELPIFGPPQAARLLTCGPWPVPADPAQPGPAAGAPPLLVLGTAADPRTPLDGSQRAAGALPSARFVSWQGAGHGAYPRTPCVTDAVNGLIFDGVLPAANVLCPP